MISESDDPTLSMMATVAAVAIGGALGALVRHFLSRWTAMVSPQAVGAGTLLVNMLACVLLGYWTHPSQPGRGLAEWQRLCLINGGVGALGTFSSLIWEMLYYWRAAGAGHWAIAVVLANLVCGYLAFVCGEALAKAHG
jgi:fluoride exporter